MPDDDDFDDMSEDEFDAAFADAEWVVAGPPPGNFYLTGGFSATVSPVQTWSTGAGVGTITYQWFPKGQDIA